MAKPEFMQYRRFAMLYLAAGATSTVGSTKAASAVFRSAATAFSPGPIVASRILSIFSSANGSEATYHALPLPNSINDISGSPVNTPVVNLLAATAPLSSTLS